MSAPPPPLPVNATYAEASNIRRGGRMRKGSGESINKSGLAE